MNYSKEVCEDWIEIGDMVLVSLKPKFGETTYHELGFIDWMEDTLTITTSIGGRKRKQNSNTFGWDEIDNIHILKFCN